MRGAISRHIGSLLLYVGGILSLLLADLYIAHQLSLQQASEWGGLKSFMMICGPLILFGVNALFIRAPNKYKSSLKISLLLVSGFGLAVSALNALGVRIFFPTSYYAVTVAYALSLTMMSLLRGVLGNFPAQLVQASWKLSLLIFIFIFTQLKILNESSKVFNYLFLSLILSATVGWILYALGRNNLIRDATERVTRRDMYFALMMLASNATVAASTYLEVLVVSRFASIEISASYFVHYTLFTSLAALTSGYVGFYLTPAIRKNPKKFRSILDLGWTRFFFVLLVLGIAAFLGISIFELFYASRYELSYSLLILLSMISLLRTVYVLPTAVMGALGEAQQLNSFIWIGFLGVGVFVLSSVVGFYLDEVVLGVLLGSLANWVLRTISAYHASRRIFRLALSNDVRS